MIGLLDVNMLIALFDPGHGHHDAAHDWFAAHRKMGWATSPLTENGLVRILSNPAYPGRRTSVEDAIGRLDSFRRSGDHTMWPDDISLCDAGRVHPHHLGGHRQLTDVYLLSLATHHRGRLVTFDRAIPLAAVPGATQGNLVLLGG